MTARWLRQEALRVAVTGAALVTALVAATCQPAGAEGIVTDRPDIAESSLSVPWGWYQVEQAVQTESGSGGNQLYFPSLHRFGIAPNVEMRVETPVTMLSAQPGFPGLAVGAKWHLLDGGEWGQLPSAALLGHAQIDPGGQVRPIGKLLIDTVLPLGFDFGVNLGSLWAEAGPAMTYAVALSHDITEAVRCYGELSGEHAVNGAAPEVGVDGGVAWLVTDDIQVDMAAYRGLTAAAPEWYLTMGVSARWGPGNQGASAYLPGLARPAQALTAL